MNYLLGLDDDDEPEPSAFSKLYLTPVLRACQETVSGRKKHDISTIKQVLMN